VRHYEGELNETISTADGARDRVLETIPVGRDE
jgi:hypothetical protein